MDYLTFYQVNKNASVSTPYYPPPPPANYTGGMLVVQDDRIKEVGVSLPGNFQCWASAYVGFAAPSFFEERKHVACYLLATLMGNGSSFSSGGPGKGMRTRVYTKILSNGCVQTGNTTYSPFYDGGLFGLTVSGNPKYTSSLQTLAITEMMNLLEINDIELARAKNQLKAQIFDNLETAPYALDDLLRQVVYTNERHGSSYYLNIIDEISNAEITAVAREILSSDPTIVIRSNVQNDVASYEAVQQYRAKHLK